MADAACSCQGDQQEQGALDSPNSPFSLKSRCKLQKKQDELKSEAKRVKDDKVQVIQKNEDARNILGLEKSLSPNNNDNE